jgi:sugar transferase (PEP-CTERM system associated)
VIWQYSPRSVAIVTVEMAWLLVSLVAVIAIDRELHRSAIDFNQLVQRVGFATFLYVASFYYCDLYNFPRLQVRRDLMAATVRTFSALAVLFGVLSLFTRWLPVTSEIILLHLALTTAFVLLVRMQIDAVLTRFGWVTRIAIVGTGTEARRLAEEVLQRREHGQEIYCFIGNDPEGVVTVRCPNPGSHSVPVFPAAVLPELAARYRVKRILVASGDLRDELPVQELLRCKAEGYEVIDGHTFYERLLGRIFVADLSPQWLIFSDGFMRSARTRTVKRVLDLVTATCVIVLTAPLAALVTLLVKLEDGGPVLFRQARVGRGGTLFTLYKFRSMQVDAEKESGPKWAEVDDPRVTRVGRWIRALRIDEIPQAWNVLRGDMSFVGPRPERPEFVAMLQTLIPYYDHRHAVRPGITGWAQVNYPYGATVEDARCKLEYDLYYLKNLSGLMDIFILIRTIKIIMFGWGSR